VQPFNGTLNKNRETFGENLRIFVDRLIMFCRACGGRAGFFSGEVNRSLENGWFDRRWSGDSGRGWRYRILCLHQVTADVTQTILL